MTLQEISDRLEIQDLMVAYSHAVDTRDWDAFDDVFTPDAIIDYTEMGGSRGTLTETKDFLRMVMPHFSSFQHMVATSKVTLNGDTVLNVIFLSITAALVIRFVKTGGIDILKMMNRPSDHREH